MTGLDPAPGGPGAHGGHGYPDRTGTPKPVSDAPAVWRTGGGAAGVHV